MIKKVVSTLVICFMVFSMPNLHYAYADDLNFLRDEITEATRHISEANVAITNMSQMIEACQGQIKKLEEAIDELDGFHHKMSQLQKINIAKATITAMFDFKDWVMLMLPGGTVVGMITSISTQYASTKVGGSLGYNAPYKKSMKQVQTDAVGMDKALKAIDNALNMTLEEVRNTGGNAAELGETGSILRKYTLIMDATRKAQGEARKLIKALENAIKDLEDSIEETKGKIPPYEKKAGEYRARLAEAEAKEMKDKVKAEFNNLKDQLPEDEEIELPADIAGSGPALRYSAWISDQYPKALDILKDYPKLVADLIDAHKDIQTKMEELIEAKKEDSVLINSPNTTYDYTNSEYIKVDNWFNNGGLLAGSIPVSDAYAEATMLSAEAWPIAAAYTNAIQAKKTLSGQGDVGASLGACDAIESAIVPYMEASKKLSTALATFSKIVQNGYNTGHQIKKEIAKDHIAYVRPPKLEALRNRKKGEELYYPSGLMSVEQILTYVASEKMFLEKMGEEKGEVLAAYSKRITALKSAFTEVMNKKKEQYQEALTLMHNTENAAKQAIAASAEYKRLISSSPWSVSGRFSITKLSDALYEAFKTHEMERIQEIKKQFDAFKGQMDSVHNKYRIGMGNVAAYQKLNTYKSHGVKDYYLKDIDPGLKSFIYSEEELSSINETLNEMRSVASVPPFDADLNSSILFIAPDLVEDIMIGYEKTSQGKSKKAKLKLIKELSERVDAFSAANPADSKILAVIRQALEKYEKQANAPEAPKKSNVKLGEAELDTDDGEGQILEWWMPRIYDIRINTVSVFNATGDIIVAPGDLINGQITVTGAIDGIDGLSKILISHDGGRQFKELDLHVGFEYSFTPMHGERYDIVLRCVRSANGKKIDIKLLPSGASLVFKDIDYNELILDAVKKMADAYEAQDVGSFTRMISREYLGNKVFLEEGVRFDFDLFNEIQLKIYVNRIEHRKNLFIVETKWDKVQVPRTTGEQQLTNGRTTMIFILEEGMMKIFNLRGNLIYATLSPEIAEASGLKSTVVDQVRTARDDRNPTQPGAGEIEDSGGVSGGGTSAALTVYTTSRDADSGFPGDNFDFESNTWTEVGAPAANFDITFEGDLVFDENGATYQLLGTTFAGTTEAPAAGYGAHPGAVSVGQVWAFITAEGNYGKMEITSKSDLGGGVTAYGFKFAVQTDSTRNLTT